MTVPVRILILGGGFAGVYCALELEKRLPHDRTTTTTVVNQHNFLLFTPMLHEVAASDVDVTHIVTPLRKLFRRTEVFEGDIEAIDLTAHRVTVSHGISSAHQHTRAYDHLVLALGSRTNFYGLLGLARGVSTRLSPYRFLLRSRPISRKPHAKSWELRATTSLGRFLRDTSRHNEVRKMLSEINN